MKRRVGSIDGSGRGTCLEQDVHELQAGQVGVAVRASLISPGTELGSLPQRRQNPDPEQSLHGQDRQGLQGVPLRACPRRQPAHRGCARAPESLDAARREALDGPEADLRVLPRGRK